MRYHLIPVIQPIWKITNSRAVICLYMFVGLCEEGPFSTAVGMLTGSPFLEKKRALYKKLRIDLLIYVIQQFHFLASPPSQMQIKLFFLNKTFWTFFIVFIVVLFTVASQNMETKCPRANKTNQNKIGGWSNSIVGISSACGQPGLILCIPYCPWSIAKS